MEIKNYIGFLVFNSNYIYNLQVIWRPFYIQLRDTTDFKWTSELPQTFDRVKKKPIDGTVRLAILNSEKSFYILCDASNYALELHFPKKNQFGKMELVSANSRSFSTTELRLPTILRQCSAIISALSEY